MTPHILGLFAGQPAPLGGGSRLSSIVKHPVDRLTLTATGPQEDQQADLTVHGGVDKAVHLYPVEHYAALADAPVVDRLRARLGRDFDAPLFIDNTNRYQAVAESEKGLAGDYRNFIIVDALPEGLGAGIVVNGRLLHGRQSIAGEIGHMTLDPNEGFPCVCGSKGCFEAMVSERRIKALARELAVSYPDSVLSAKTDAITLHDVCAGVISGDALCQRLIDDVARWYVIGLGNIIMANDPELIVLQGIYTQAGPYFLEKVRDGLRNVGLPQVKKTVEVAYSRLGDDRGVIGGALHVITAYLANHAY